MAEIKDKKEMYDLYHAGAFGNMLKAWPSVQAFLEDVRDGKWEVFKPVALRTKHKPGVELPNYCSPTWPGVVLSLASEWVSKHGVQPTDITLNEIGPDDKIVLQGEIQRSIRGYELTYSLVKTLMREALKQETKYLHGTVAIQRVRIAMDADSYDNLHRLFDEYPDSVIEFSCYAVSIGTENLNTVFWEVRNY